MSPSRAVLVVSWPMVAIGVLKTGYFLANSFWLGWMGDDALVASGGAAFAWWILLLLGETAGTGALALAARSVGARDDASLPGIAAQAAWVALLVGMAVQALHPLVPTYLGLLGYEPGSPAFRLAATYLHVAIAGTVAMALHSALGGVFRGIGSTVIVLLITGTTVVLNLLVDPLLIWGYGPFPALGIAGAAAATVLANMVGAALAALALTWYGIRPGLAPPDPERIRQIVAIGLPVTARGVAFSAIYVVLGRMITSFGTHQMAALGVGHRIESIPYLVTVGFEVGCATLVGQYLGAGDPAGARRAARAALGWALGFMVPATAFLLVAADGLFALFANEPGTIAAGALYLRIQAVVFVFMAFESVYEGAFTGAARTMTSFWIGAAGTLLRIPMAAFLAWGLGFGVSGIWWAIALSTALKGVALAWAFGRTGLGPGPDDGSGLR